VTYMAAVIAVVLSMPGFPEREYREVVADLPTCVQVSQVLHTEVYRYAFLEDIPFDAVKLKVTCSSTLPVSSR
jgi:hypothetical protein